MVAREQSQRVGSGSGRARLAISTRGLARRFGATHAVRPLDLDVAEGEIFGLLGHNGAGKTTTIRLLNGVLASSAGSARVLGFDPATEGTKLRARTGVATETPSLDERLTGRQGLRFFADLYGVPREHVASRVDAQLQRFGLGHAADHRIATYSKGMRQRLTLARALLHDPDLVFLDEPTSGLDPVARHEVEGVIRGFARRKGKTVLLCTHDLAQAQALCARVAVLEHGRVIASGRPEELARDAGSRGRVRVELGRGHVPDALHALRGNPRFTNAATDGDALLLDVDDRESVPELLALLVEAGERVYGVRLAEPSLEDVYFALHGEGRREVRS